MQIFKNIVATSNSRWQQPRTTVLLLIMAFYLALNSCQKTEMPIPQTSTGEESTTVESRDPELKDVVTYFVDNVETTKSNYDNLPTSFWFHDVVTKEANTRLTKAHAFSTKAIYELWGNSAGVPVTRLNQFDDQVDALAISYGIAQIVGSGGTPSQDLADAYLSAVNAAYVDLFPPSQTTSILNYAGSKFWSNSCTPSSPGCNNGSAFFLPTYLSMPSWFLPIPVWSWMEDNSEAWEPLVTANNSMPFKITLRAYSYPFFITPPLQSWKKKVTAVIPSGTNSLFIPFANSLQVWSNKISSWNIFPSL